jgi:hypothetical protein
MKLRVLGFLSLALAVCLSSALVAQDQPGRQRGQRGQGGPGGGGPGGPRGFGFGGGATELMMLLRMEEVRKEVDMTDETYEAVQTAARENMSGLADLRDASEAERTAKMKELNDKTQELLDEVLSPDHQKRLMGLLVQQRGMSASTNDLIAKEIGLDEAGVKKVEEAAAKSREGMREKMMEVFQAARGGGAGGAGGGFDREKMQAMMEENQKETDKAIAAVLTEPQKKALENLKGAKFEFPEGGMFGGRGGFGGGRGAGGPGGGRPGGAGGRPGGAGGRPGGGGRPGTGN